MVDTLKISVSKIASTHKGLCEIIAVIIADRASNAFLSSCKLNHNSVVDEPTVTTKATRDIYITDSYIVNTTNAMRVFADTNKA